VFSPAPTAEERRAAAIRREHLPGLAPPQAAEEREEPRRLQALRHDRKAWEEAPGPAGAQIPVADVGADGADGAAGGRGGQVFRAVEPKRLPVQPAGAGRQQEELGPVPAVRREDLPRGDGAGWRGAG